MSRRLLRALLATLDDILNDSVQPLSEGSGAVDYGRCVEQFFGPRPSRDLWGD